MKNAACLFLFVFLVSALFIPAAEPAYAEGQPPLAESFELSTLMNSPYEGQLTASDDDSEKLFFEITTKPVKGEITLNEDGSFVYMPRENKKGRDYFGYKAIDPEGNYSQEATVIIRINKGLSHYEPLPVK